MKVLLHACCGPCSLEPVRIYEEEQTEFAIYFSNPNIFPAEEYQHRLTTLQQHVTSPHKLQLFEGEYDPDTWEKEVGIHGLDKENRCRACYRLRFKRLAKAAKDNGYDAIGSTLTISPYQYTDAILEELESAACEQDVKSDGRDFSSHYQNATRISKDLGMYRQNYCGCRYSIAEAELERKQRANQREKEKLIKQNALLQAAAEGVVNQASQL